MEGVTAWYLILGISILVIAFVVRYSTYTFLVRIKRWLPEKASGMANSVTIGVLVVAAITLVGKALVLSR